MSLLLLVRPAVAQDRIDGVASAIQLIVPPADTIIVALDTNINNALDTLKIPKLHTHGGIQALDSTSSVAMKLKVYVQDVQDSVGRSAQTPIDKLYEVKLQMQSSTDTLLRQMNAPIDDVNSSLRKKEQAVQSKYNNVAENIQRKVPAGWHELNINADKTEVGNLINEKMLGQPATLPVIEVPHNGVTLPDIREAHPAVVPALEISSETTQTPGNLDLKQTDPSRKVDLDVPAAKNVIGATGGANGMQDHMAEIQKRSEEVQSIRENSLPVMEELSSEVEGRVERLDEMKALGQADNKVSEHYNVVQRYKDKKLLEQEIRRKASNIANDYLIKKAPQVKQGVETLNKGKSLVGKFGKARKMFKDQPSELKEKKFHQRLVPALTTQVHRMEGVNIDFALQLGYRLTPRLTTGFGGIVRANFGEQVEKFLEYGGVNGGRTYAEFALVKGLFAYGDFEVLCVHPMAVKPITYETMPDYILGSYFGLGKRFNLSRNIKGTLLGLYRAEYKGKLAVANPFNMRLGFEYNMLKRKKRRF